MCHGKYRSTFLVHIERHGVLRVEERNVHSRLGSTSGGLPTLINTTCYTWPHLLGTPPGLNPYQMEVWCLFSHLLHLDFEWHSLLMWPEWRHTKKCPDFQRICFCLRLEWPPCSLLMNVHVGNNQFINLPGRAPAITVAALYRLFFPEVMLDDGLFATTHSLACSSSWRFFKRTSKLQSFSGTFLLII